MSVSAHQDTFAADNLPPRALWPDRRTLCSFAVAIGGRARREALRALLDARSRWHDGRQEEPAESA